MDVRVTNIPGVQLLKPRYFYDSRGHFVETYNKRSARELGLVARFVQDNESLSVRPGTIRGLHFQTPPKSQAKLVRVLRGSIYDVAVDLRVGSPSYGRWAADTLTADGGEQFFVPGSENAVLSDKDRKFGRFADFVSPFRYHHS